MCRNRGQTAPLCPSLNHTSAPLSTAKQNDSHVKLRFTSPTSLLFFSLSLQQIMYGDLSANPIDDLAVIVDEIFYPIISNPRNQEGWPDVIKKDVDSHFQDLRNIITEVITGGLRVERHIITSELLSFASPANPTPDPLNENRHTKRCEFTVVNVGSSESLCVWVGFVQEAH